MARSRRIRRYCRRLGGTGPDWIPFSHWALVIGEPAELLLEVVAVVGRSWVTPKNHLQINYAGPALQEKLLHFRKFGPEKDRTEFTDEAIVHAAKTILGANPIYNILGRNCQAFVMDLEYLIMAKSWFDKVFRRRPVETASVENRANLQMETLTEMSRVKRSTIWDNSDEYNELSKFGQPALDIFDESEYALDIFDESEYAKTVELWQEMGFLPTHSSPETEHEVINQLSQGKSRLISYDVPELDDSQWPMLGEEIVKAYQEMPAAANHCDESWAPDDD